MFINYKLDRIPILTDYKRKVVLNPPGEPESIIEYAYNDYGYRSFDNYRKLLQNKDKIICIGCSFTFGIGLEYEEIWPTQLSLMLNKPVINLGLPGGSHGYVIWQILNVLNNIQQNNIFVVIPPKGRSFNLKENSFENNNNLEGDTAKKTIFNVSSAENDDLLLKSLCKYHNIPYIECYQYGQPFLEKWAPPARDGGHFGKKWNRFIATEFRKNI